MAAPRASANRTADEGPTQGVSPPKVTQVTTVRFSVLHALIELRAEGQALQAAWQSHLLHALNEVRAKGQALHAAWQSHLHHVLIELRARGQALQAAWQSHLYRAPNVHRH